MPGWLLDVYATMRPRLEAESLLAQHEAIFMASERVKGHDRQRWITDLRRTAGVDVGRTKPRTPNDWAAQGMKVRRVQRRREPGEE